MLFLILYINKNEKRYMEYSDNSSQAKEDLSISFICALCANAGIDYEICRHDQDSTDGIIKKLFF